MEKGRVKLFAEVNDQEIRYAAFELADNSNYNLLIKKISKNHGIKNGAVVDLNIATETISKDLKGKAEFYVKIRKSSSAYETV